MCAILFRIEVLLLYWYALAVILILIASCEIYTFKTGVPTVTSFPSSRKKMIEILKGEWARHEKESSFTILDLGSGTGKLVLEIAKALPSARVIGIEISLTPFLFSLFRKRLWGAGNADFKREDFWSYDLSGVDAIVLYINAKIRERMAKKLEKELPVGALVISNETHLPGWTPLETHDAGFLKLKVVVYRKD